MSNIPQVDSSRVMLQPDPRATKEEDLNDLTNTYKTVDADKPVAYNWEAAALVAFSVALIAIGIFALATGVGAGLGVTLICLGGVLGLSYSGYKFYKAKNVESIVDDATSRRLDKTLYKIHARNNAANQAAQIQAQAPVQQQMRPVYFQPQAQQQAFNPQYPQYGQSQAYNMQRLPFVQ